MKRLLRFGLKLLLCLLAFSLWTMMWMSAYRVLTLVSAGTVVILGVGYLARGWARSSTYALLAGTIAAIPVELALVWIMK